jgi:O-antigen/teichoic acid export membrane protein
VVCIAASPYPLRLRFDSETLRGYVSFSWPLLGLGITRLLIVQGSLLTANRVVGLAGVGAIGLAANFAAFSDRVNQIISQTIYPAVCRVADRGEALLEVFVKSNRLALMWAMPFGAGLALFAGDLVRYLLGDQWTPAIGLLAAFGVVAGYGQLAFNWTVFMRALNRTRPLLVAALIDLVVFAVVMLPAIIAFGLPGYAAGFATSTAVQIVVRTHYMRTLFPTFAIVRHMIRAVMPALPPVALVLALRTLLGGDRELAQAIGELTLYVLATAASTYFFERRLIGEMLGYLRGRRAPKPDSAEATVAV